MKTGCNPNFRNVDGITPLMMAVDNGNTEMCKYFMENVDEKTRATMLSSTDNNGRTALHYSVSKGFNDITQLFFNQLSVISQKRNWGVDHSDENGNTLLFSAAGAGSFETLVSLLDLGADLQKCNVNGSTPLHNAINNGRHENADELLRRGSNINAADCQGLSPFLICSYHTNIAMLKSSLQHNPCLNHVDNNGDSCIHLASAANNKECLKILLSFEECRILSGDNNKQGNNALHLAAMEGNLDASEILLQQLDCELLYLQNSSQQLAIHLAAEKGHTEIIKNIVANDKKIVVSRDVDNNTPLHLAAKNGHSETIKFLLSCEISFNEELNDLKQSALHCAACDGHVEAADILIESGFDVNAQDSKKATPLHVAAKMGKSEMIKFLLRKNGNVSMIDSNGRNPLDCAITLGGEACVMEIIKSSKWRSALRNLRILDKATGEITSPMRQLIKFMPNSAKYVLDRCTTIYGQESPENMDYQATFDYEFIEDLYNAEIWQLMNAGQDESEINPKDLNVYHEDEEEELECKHTQDTNNIIKYHPINIMAMTKQTELLSHPLVETLVDYKWMWFGRNVYFIFMFIYVGFLISYNIIVLSHIPPYAVKVVGNTSNACVVLLTTNYHNCTCCTHADMHPDITLKIVVSLFTAINLFKEVLQMINRKSIYFHSFDNYIEIFSYISAVLFLIDMNEFSASTGIKEEWQWILACYGLFASWITLALFIRKIPSVGLFVIMLSDVGLSFLRFAGVYLVFVIAFAFPYHMLLQNQVMFGTWWKSMIKTLVMTVGEIEFLSMFYSCEDDNAENECGGFVPGREVQYRAATFIFFICFIATMPIIVMNLLIGLAVDDIKSVLENARHKKMIMKISLALEVEYLLPEKVRRHFLKPTLFICPNKDNKRSLFWSIFWDDVTSAHRLQSEITKVGNAEISNGSELVQIERRLKQLDNDNKELKNICSDIVNKLS